MTKTRWWLAAVGLTVGIIVPAGVLIALAEAPRIILGVADVGTFTAAQVSGGGLFSPSLTTVQTSDGTITVRHEFSAQRGQPLRVSKDLTRGMQLCTTGQRATCVEMAGQWAGALRAIPHQHHPFVALAGRIGRRAAGMWLMSGFTLCLFAGLSLIGDAQEEAERGSRSGYHATPTE